MATTPESGSEGSLTLKLWRGERMCLLGMDAADPDPSFVGFAIEVQSPGAQDFMPLRNRLAFDYPAGKTLTGNREYPTTEAPIQTFRWIHFPYDPQPGHYAYRVTMMHMDAAGQLSAGDSVTCSILLCDQTSAGFVDVGFTRNFASSQAFADKFPDPAQRKLILPPPDQGLGWNKGNAPAGVYDWLGGKANNLLRKLLDEARADATITLDVMAYDLNEPDFLAALLAVAGRSIDGKPALRILIDNSGDHKAANSCETSAATQLAAAGALVQRHHFDGLQHNKVIIAHKGGVPYRAIGGSTNFSFRGLYIQANNLLAFDAPEVINAFSSMFELAFAGPHALEQNALSKAWQVATAPSGATVRLCFSPHPDNSDLSLSPLAGAIQQASSSVLYAVAFLNQDLHGPTRTALDDLMGKPVFSYGIANRRSGLRLTKPDGSTGLVDFEYLSAHAPQPFSAEWSGGAGITIHHKFVVVDFSLPTAKVFAGSSNLSVSGEEGNGDHLVQISDQRVATAYAVEALRMFDHLNFRTKMKASAPTSDPHSVGVIRLQKPPAAGKPAWFAPFYVADSQKQRDRMLFSR
jgi:phosphatidylserine/phosphatidylglycerophosphate/cardiolipin synthase-like enzyme